MYINRACSAYLLIVVVAHTLNHVRMMQSVRVTVLVNEG